MVFAATNTSNKENKRSPVLSLLFEMVFATDGKKPSQLRVSSSQGQISETWHLGSKKREGAGGFGRVNDPEGRQLRGEEKQMVLEGRWWLGRKLESVQK